MKLENGHTIVVIVGKGADLDGIEARKAVNFENFDDCQYQNSQWQRLEEMREKTGGIIYALPRRDNSIYELVLPYLGEDGYIKEQGFKVVETKSHGKFAVYLVELPLRDDWVEDEDEEEVEE